MISILFVFLCFILQCSTSSHIIVIQKLTWNDNVFRWCGLVSSKNCLSYGKTNWNMIPHPKLSVNQSVPTKLFGNYNKMRFLQINTSSLTQENHGWLILWHQFYGIKQQRDEQKKEEKSNKTFTSIIFS